MLFQVYRYDVEGKFLYDDLIEEVLDDEGKHIIPEGCTDIAPPPLGTEPIFKDGSWYPTKEWNPPEPQPPQPSPLEILQEEVKALKEEIVTLKGIQEAVKAIAEEAKNISRLETVEATIKSQGKRISDLDSTLQNTRYYLTLVIPQFEHYFRN